MSSDNFDLEAADGRVWGNLGMSSYEGLSSEAIVAVMELTGEKPGNGGEYTEYGCLVAGVPTLADHLAALVYVVRQLCWQIRFLQQELDERHTL